VAVDDEDTMGDGADDVMFVEAKLAGSADLRLERGVPCPPVANPLGRRDCSIDRAGEAWILTRCMMSNIEALPTAVAPTNLGWSRVPDDRLRRARSATQRRPRDPDHLQADPAVPFLGAATAAAARACCSGARRPRGCSAGRPRAAT